MHSRYYLVTDQNGKTHLVNAVSQAQAIGHIARASMTCKVATTKEVVEAMQAGAKTVDATSVGG